MNKNDLRYQKTDIVIKKAFEECVNEYGFEKTTVSMICEKAMVNRNTFYIHFESKYDLLDKLFLDVSEEIKNKASKKIMKSKNELEFYTNSEWFVDALIENRKNFLLLSKCDDKRMEEFYEKNFVDMPLKNIINNYYEKKKDFLIQLNIKYQIGAVLNFVKYWFENFDRISREEAIEELAKLNKCEIDDFFNRMKIN